MNRKRKFKTTTLIHLACLIILLGGLTSLFSYEEQVNVFEKELTNLEKFEGMGLYLDSYNEVENKPYLDIAYVDVNGYLSNGAKNGIAGTLSLNQPIKDGLTTIFYQGKSVAKEVDLVTKEVIEKPYYSILVKWDFSYYIVIPGMWLLFISLILHNIRRVK